VILRPAITADVPALAGIAAESYQTAFADFLDPVALAGRDTKFFSGYFPEVLDRVRLAEIDGRVRGFSQVTKSHLDMLFVAQADHGTGVGSALLRQAEALGAATLECFRDNKQARDFYEHRGWRLAQSYERPFIGQIRAFVLYEKG
jgi:putative acetyltransferase